MAWTFDYTATARKPLRKLDSHVARRIVDFMDERVATKSGLRRTGKALTGPMLGTYWRYRVGDCLVICDIQDGALRVLVIQTCSSPTTSTSSSASPTRWR